MKKFLTDTLPRLIITMAITAASVLLGFFLLKSVPESLDGLFCGLSVGAIALLILCLIADRIASRIFFKNLKKDTVRENQEYILARAETIRSDYLAAKKKLRRLRIGIKAYVAFCLLLCIATMMLWINAPQTPNIVIVPAIAFLFCVIESVGVGNNKVDLSQYTAPDDYPLIYSVAQSAADKIGVKGEIHICLIGGDSAAGIARIGKIISIQLNPSLLAYSRKEELYAVLLHEMAHIKNTDTDIADDMRFIDFLSGCEWNDNFHITLFPYALAKYSFEHLIYRQLASVIVEEKADRAMGEHSDPQTAANALFKIDCYDRFYQNTDLYMDKLFYESETPCENLTEVITERFLAIMHGEEEKWRYLTEVEIQPRNATHPILRTRIAAVGATSYGLCDPEADGAFREECRKAVKTSDGELAKNISEGYSERREQEYLKPLSVVNSWEERGRPCDFEDAREVLDSLNMLCRNEELLAFADEIIEKHSGGIVAYAKFIRGCKRLGLGDESGIDDVYEAVEINNNYIGSGLEKIGEFCCRYGLAGRLEEYRERCVGYYQRGMDQEEDGISASADLSPETQMPAHIAERNLEFIKKTAGASLRSVRLVHKKVTEDFSASIYIIEFFAATKQEDISAAMNRIFEHLDNDPDDWQYSLYLYSYDMEKSLSRVEGSLIYLREED